MKLNTNSFIEKLRSRNASDTILRDGDKFITAGELVKTASQLAAALSKDGVRNGDRVVLAVKPGIEFLQVIYANMMLGTVMAIIDPEMGRDNYRNKLNQLAPQHAFVDRRLLFINEHPILRFFILKIFKSIPSFPKVKNCAIYSTGSKLPLVRKTKHVSTLLAGPLMAFEFETISPNTDFMVTYTSGTVSEPKGVVHSYSSLYQSILHLAELLKTNGDTIIATHLPHYALLGITAGIKVYLWDHNMSSLQKIKFINDYKISTLFGPPSDFIPLMNVLCKNQMTFPESIKNIYLGSAPIYSTFLSRLVPLCPSINVTCLYGMTENLMVAFIDGREKLNETIEGDLVGHPFPDVEISLGDDGEVCLRSNQLYSHYWTQNRSNTIHHSGDIGRMDDKGRLILCGRKKDMIIRGNFNIYPGLYEPTIHKIKGINEAVLIGVYDDQKADEVVILAVDADNGLQNSDVMKQLTTGKYSIDKAAIPDEIIFMKIPHSGRHNKVDRKKLVEKIKQLRK